MKIKYDVSSQTGPVRQNNEDMALVMGCLVRDDYQRSMVPMASRPRFSALVADGMGGYGGGEIASEMILKAFDNWLIALPDGLDDLQVIGELKQWFERINEQIITEGQKSAETTNMGCTLTGIFTYGPYDFMINAGDSRVYRYRYETLRQLSTDHSERERLNDPNVPSNIIYNAAGIPGAFIDVTCLNTTAPIIDQDIYVICSDGLCDMITDNQIEQILQAGGSTRELVDAALQAGGRDNCTVITLNVAIPPQEETRQQETVEEADAPSETQEIQIVTETPAIPAIPEIPATPANPNSPLLPESQIIDLNLGHRYHTQENLAEETPKKEEDIVITEDVIEDKLSENRINQALGHIKTAITLLFKPKKM